MCIRDRTTALGFTPYNNSNPSGYITSSALSGYLTSASAASTYLPLSGGTVNGGVVIDGGSSNQGSDATLYVTASNSNDWGIRIGKASSDYGIVTEMGAGTVYGLRIMFGGTERFRVGDSSQTISGNQILHAGNYNSYAPTLTGTGASGTWNISITGTAATATSAPNYLPLAGGTLTGKVTFPSATANQPQMPNGFLGLDTGDANFDIWGISRDYYPSNPTAANAWGIRWDGDGNQIRFIGGGNVRVSFDLDDGTTQINGNTVLHAGNYNSYSPTLTGTGASGTWGISISGNAATATSANSATTAGSTTYLAALGSYVWSASTNGRSFNSGIQTSFVQSSNGYPSYGSVVRIATYPNDGATAELYFPYSNIYGGSAMLYRLGQYDNAGWTGWKTVIDSTNYNSYALPLSGGTLSGVLTLVSGGTAINISGQSDSFGYNATAGQGTYIKGTGATYIYGGGKFFDGATVQTLLHAGNYTSYAATANHNHTYDVNNAWLRDANDDANVKLYGNTRQMVFRTDGTTEFASGVGGYAFAWMYGGDSAGERRMLLASDGRLWTNYHGWLDTMSVAYASTAGSADAIDGVGFRNTGSNSSTNADNIESNGITYYTAGVTNFSGNATDGALYSQAYSSAWQHQIAGDYRSGQIALRGKNNGTWQSWRTVLDSSNYSSYALPLGGGTLTGNLTMSGPGASNSIIFGDTTKRINVEGYWMMFKGHENEGFRWQTAGQDGATYTTRMQLTSSVLTLNGNVALDFGPNTTWGATLRVGGNGHGGGSRASVVTTNGNLHLDGSNSSGIYLGWYNTSTSGTYFGNGAGGQVGRIDGAGNGSFNGRFTVSAWTTSGRNYSNEWIEFGNHSGLYSPINSAHFYPNDQDYGPWRINGSRNGWNGLWFDTGSTLMMNGNEVGFHRSGHGWQMRWQTGTGYVNKGNPGGGTSAAILDASNWTNYVPVSYPGWPGSPGTNANDFYAGSWVRSSFTYSNNAPLTGTIVHFPAGGYDLQLNANYNGHDMAFRSRNGDAASWMSWKTVLNTNNYNSYSPTLTGGNASGTWSINVTGTAYGLNVHTGRNNEVNRVVRTDANGYIQAGWINTTSGNSGFESRLTRIYASNDDYLRYLPLTDFKVSMGESAKNSYSRRVDYTSDANYHVGSFGHSGYGANETFHGGSGFFDIWSGTNYPPSTSHIHGFNALHYTTNSLGSTGGTAYGIQLAGQYDQGGLVFTRACSGGSFSAWRRQIDDNNYNSYSPTLTGGNASGTWGIAITGNSGNTSSISNAVGGGYTWTGIQYFMSNRNTTSDSPPLQAFSSGGGGAIMSFHRGGYYAVNFGLDSDNVMRIGGWSAAANRWQLDMSGNGTYAGNVTAYSDERLKTNWQPMPDDYVARLAQVKVGIYDRVDEKGLTQVGVSAQSFQTLLPQAIMTANDEMQTLSVNYGGAALASAVELAKRVVDQEKRIAYLESLINKLIGD